MSTTYAIGCKAIRVGDKGAGGTMGATLADAGKPYKGTVSIVDEDGTVTKHFAENERYPLVTILESGGTQVKFTLVDMTPAVLAAWVGGKAEGTGWESAKTHFSVEKSIEFDTVEEGLTIQIANCFLYGKLGWNLSRTEIMKIEVTGEVQQPDAAETPPIKLVPSTPPVG